MSVEDKINLKKVMSRGPRDRLSYLGSASSDLAFLGMASVISSERKKGGLNSTKDRKRCTSSWVGFGQYNSLGGLKFSEKTDSVAFVSHGQFRRHRQMDVLVHIGRGAMTLSSVLPRGSSVKPDDKLAGVDLSSEKELSCLVGETLMGLPIGLTKKEGVYFLEVLFCQKRIDEVEGARDAGNEAGGKSSVAVLGGYAFLPYVESEGVEQELFRFLGNPRNFRCRGVIDGKLMLTFVEPLRKK